MAGKRRANFDGDALVYYRERKMWTQEQLAEKAKVSEGTISRLENERHGARFSTVNKLAKALGIDPDELVDSDPPTPNNKAA